mmetsp:Transcript_17973/g.22062  ORF Transcript_17973/g.22062 Transcript_17973/m.22062 type:complete len:101 (+) Transcript_17973:123-425(+)
MFSLSKRCENFKIEAMELETKSIDFERKSIAKQQRCEKLHTKVKEYQARLELEISKLEYYSQIICKCQGSFISSRETSFSSSSTDKFVNKNPNNLFYFTA